MGYDFWGTERTLEEFNINRLREKFQEAAVEICIKNKRIRVSLRGSKWEKETNDKLKMLKYLERYLALFSFLLSFGLSHFM